MSMYDNEEGQSLDEYENEGEGENVGYISLPFVDPLYLLKRSQTT